MTEQTAQSLTGVVSRIIYRNEENAYLVAELSTPEGGMVVTGYAAGLSQGETVTAQGSYVTHPSYGRQFNADSMVSSLPSTADAILIYLESGAVRGIGKTLAGRIVGRFGEQTLEVLERFPARLAEVEGITPARAAAIAGRFAQAQGVRRVLAELGGLALPPHVAVKLYKRYGEAAVAALRQDPYLLCREEYGMDFGEVDETAISRFDIEPQSMSRVQAGILHVLTHNLGNGHTFLPDERLIETAADFLEVEPDLVMDATERLKGQGTLVEAAVANLDGLFLSRYHEAEAAIADRLLELVQRSPQTGERDRIEQAVVELERSLGIDYDDLQRKAILDCAREGVFILTGGPGTGKTTTLRGILLLMERLGLRTLLAAPTGRAAKRMSELTGAPAATIHRMLGVTLQGGQPRFRFHEHNQLEADVLIVDEVSMLEVTLFDALLKALKPEARLILVGDANQLPPVGAGNILRDMLGSELFSAVELTKIFRQAQDSLIVVNAHAINAGRHPNFNARDNDFFLVQCKDRTQAGQMVADLVSTRLPKAYNIDPMEDIQVITPTRKTEWGTVALNTVLQQALNPPTPGKAEHRAMGVVYRLGDRVMQIRNNYELPAVLLETGEVGAGVFNGDMGRITDIDAAGESMTIRFDDRQIEYPFDCLNQLELAYAVTVHKSQGSEYPLVVFPAFSGMGRLQTRNLLYTAVTRAKNMFVALGEAEALGAMVDNSREDRRFSALKYFLMDRIRGNVGIG